MGESSLAGVTGLAQDLCEILSGLGIVFLCTTDQATANQDVDTLSVVGKHEKPLRVELTRLLGLTALLVGFRQTQEHQITPGISGKALQEGFACGDLRRQLANG